MAASTIDFYIEWFETQTDLSHCSACKEIIYSKMYEMILFINIKIEETDIKLCQSCYAQMEKYE